MRFNLYKLTLMLLIPALGIGLALVLASNSEGTDAAAEVTTTNKTVAESYVENELRSQDTEPSVAAGRGPHVQTEAGMDLLERASRFENAFFERNLSDTRSLVIDRVRQFADDSYIQWLETYFDLSEYKEDREDGIIRRAEAEPRNMEVVHTGSGGDEVWLVARFKIREFDAANDRFVRSFQVEHRSAWAFIDNEWLIIDLPADTS